MSEALAFGGGDDGGKRQRAAERMRRSRTRRSTGGVLVHFELSGEGVAVLVELGWLAGADRHNPAAVRDAFGRFVNAAAAAGFAPARGR